MSKLHATEYLAHSEKHPTKPVCVLCGDDAFLKQQVFLSFRKILLGEEDAEFSLTRFEGNQVLFSKVIEELSTMAMFGGETRVVVVDDADSFVSKYRSDLEDYAGKPSRTGVLVLQVGSWPSNTRLYKLIGASGFTVDCSGLSESAIPQWLIQWSKARHKITCEPAAAEMLVDLVGPELGLLDQELSKLALSVPTGEKLTAEIVRKNVGSWRTRSCWEMLDLALSGNTPEAIRQLDLLFMSGENPVGLLAMIAATLRRLAAATQLILDAERLKRKITLTAALEQAGVKRFILQKSEQQLRTLGRHRGKQLLQWLIQTDLDLKGNSRSDPRLILERFIIKISAPRLKT